MREHFDSRKRIYDLYSFDVPYDLEPGGLSGLFQDYAGEFTAGKRSAFVVAEDEDDKLTGLDLTLEEAEPDRHFPVPGFDLVSDREGLGEGRRKPSPVLAATLSQRKKLLKERIEELLADIRKREKLEEQMLEKADVEGAGLAVLLGGVSSFSPGNYPSVDARRTNLEREILVLKKAGWDERLRCWRDMVMLKKELREALEEYHLVLSAEGL